jgi:hypothetical protein
MTATKRTINGTQYNVPQMVDEAIAAVENMTLDSAAARQSLAFLGNRNPTDEQVTRYAREKAILNILSRATKANFGGQLGKISFDNREQAIQGVNDYLGRRIQGQHASWTANHR